MLRGAGVHRLASPACVTGVEAPGHGVWPAVPHSLQPRTSLHSCRHVPGSLFHFSRFGGCVVPITLVMKSSLMTNEVEFISMYFLAIQIFFFVKYVFRSFVYFSIGLSVFFLFVSGF